MGECKPCTSKYRKQLFWVLRNDCCVRGNFLHVRVVHVSNNSFKFYAAFQFVMSGTKCCMVKYHMRFEVLKIETQFKVLSPYQNLRYPYGKRVQAFFNWFICNCSYNLCVHGSVLLDLLRR